jgi:MYXO-CTERM domain-containing protein
MTMGIFPVRRILSLAVLILAWSLAQAQVATLPNPSSASSPHNVEVKNGATVSVVVEPSTIPPCACQCNDVGCRLKCNQSAANGTDTLSGSLALVGTFGVGGLAFLRRRRNQKLSDVVKQSKESDVKVP